jgi:hypothetical protein
MDKFKILQTFYMCVFHSSKKAINMHKGGGWIGLQNICNDANRLCKTLAQQSKSTCIYVPVSCDFSKG